MKLEDIVVIYKTEKYKYWYPTTPEGSIISQYYIFDSHKDYLDKYLTHYKNLPDLTKVIIDAVDGRFELTNQGVTSFVKHNHQKQYADNEGNIRGIDPELMRKVRNNIIKEIGSFKVVDSFDELFDLISNCKESGFGELAIYDTSVRIGAYLNIKPDKVYLHRGSRTGMEKLEQRGYVEVGTSQLLKVENTRLPIELGELEPIEIEHFLCSQKHHLSNLEENPTRLLH